MACLCSSPSAWLHAAESSAGGDQIVTDRPDVIESAEVVGKGRFQIETSVNYEHDERAGTTTKTFTTPTLFRLGVAEDFELRLETDGRVRERIDAPGGAETRSGWADAAIGVKWHMQDGDEASGKPSIAWLIHADVDTGSREFRGQGVRPSVRGVLEWSLPQDFSLAAMAGAIRDRDTETGEKFTSGILAVALGKELSDRARLVAEIAATQIASEKHGGTIALVDFGAAYLLTRYTQVDFGVALGINSDSPDVAVTLGLSMKF